MTRRVRRHSNQRRTHTRGHATPALQRETAKEGNGLSNAVRQYQLRVNASGDAYEQEADLIAQQVVQAPPDARALAGEEQHTTLAEQVTPLLQRQEMIEDEEKPVAAQQEPSEEQEKKKEEEEPVQAKQAQRQAQGAEEEEEETVQMSRRGSKVTPEVEARIADLQQGGLPLDVAERAYFEARFGADFDAVRVHTDAEAARIAEAVDAHAFAQGEHLFFGAGQYQPHDTPGRTLIAHELTHTLQQGTTAAHAGQLPSHTHAAIQPEQKDAPAPFVALPAAEGTPYAISMEGVQFTAAPAGESQEQ
jgi:hypothetical protein